MFVWGGEHAVYIVCVGRECASRVVCVCVQAECVWCVCVCVCEPCVWCVVCVCVCVCVCGGGVHVVCARSVSVCVCVWCARRVCVGG